MKYETRHRVSYRRDDKVYDVEVVHDNSGVRMTPSPHIVLRPVDRVMIANSAGLIRPEDRQAAFEEAFRLEVESDPFRC